MAQLRSPPDCLVHLARLARRLEDPGRRSAAESIADPAKGLSSRNPAAPNKAKETAEQHSGSGRKERTIHRGRARIYWVRPHSVENNIEWILYWVVAGDVQCGG